jgi:hypothetical protein
MKNTQYTAKGETFVMEEDPSSPGLYRPVLSMGQRQSQSRGGRSSYPSYYRPRSNSKLGTYRGYIPYWYRDYLEHKWDRQKLIGITAVVSPIILTVLPRLLGFFQP